MDRLFGLGERLTSFDFTDELAPLMDTVSLSPRTTALFLTGLKSQLDPIFSDVRQETINRLAASNQLESSVLPSELGRIEERQRGLFTQAGTQFGLADTERALRNRLSLFGTGLQTTESAINLAGSAEERKGRFEQQGFENRLGLNLLEESRQPGGFFGALKGGIGAGAAGFAMGGPIGAGVGMLAGGLAGGFGQQDIGDFLFQTGVPVGARFGNFGSPRGSAGALSGGLEEFDFGVGGNTGRFGDLLDRYGNVPIFR